MLSFQININELTWIVLTSVILTLLFDTPFGNVKKLLFNKKPKSATTNTKTAETTANNNLMATRNNNVQEMGVASEVATKEL